jgi:hypothetical protein
MVKRPEDFEYSGHRAYLGLDRSGLVDTQPVLRHFGAIKKGAVEVYTRFVEASLGEKSQDAYYRAAEGRVLGSDEFVKEISHRVGEHRGQRQIFDGPSVEDLLRAAEQSSQLSRREMCSKSKNRRTVAVREAVIVVGRELGIRNCELAEALGIDASAVTRRVEASRARGAESPDLKKLRKALRSKTLRLSKSQRSQA